MTLERIDPNEIPGVSRKESQVAHIIREFLESGNEAAIIRGTELSSKVLRRLLHSYTKRHKIPVAVLRRSNVVYLKLLEEGEQLEEEEED